MSKSVLTNIYEIITNIVIQHNKIKLYLLNYHKIMWKSQGFSSDYLQTTYINSRKK